MSLEEPGVGGGLGRGMVVLPFGCVPLTSGRRAKKSLSEYEAVVGGCYTARAPVRNDEELLKATRSVSSAVQLCSTLGDLPPAQCATGMVAEVRASTLNDSTAMARDSVLLVPALVGCGKAGVISLCCDWAPPRAREHVG